MKNRLFVVGMLGLLAALPATFVRADNSAAPTPNAKNRPWDASQVQKTLGLTDDQVAKLNALMKTQKNTMQPMAEKQKDLLKKLDDQVRAKAANADIQTTLDALQASRKAMAAQGEQFRIQRAAILTPTQEAKMMLAQLRPIRRKVHKEAKDE